MTRAGALAAEAIRIALSQPVATAVTALIVAAVCAVVISTTGQTIAIERDVLRRIDDAGTRTIVVEDLDGGGELEPSAVERIMALGGVEWAVGFGVAADVRPAGLDGAAAVPMRPYFGTLPAAVTATPWDRQPGTALAGVDAVELLGFETAAGPVDVAQARRQIAVVGWFAGEPPLDFLNRSLITVSGDDEAVIRIIALAKSAAIVPPLSTAIASVLDPVDQASIAVQTSDALVGIRAAVQGELGTFGRNIIAGSLIAGLMLTGLNVFAAVTARRRDFGRRRALGASRLDILSLVILQTAVTASVGAVLGSLAGTLIGQQLVAAAPQPDFNVAVAVLAVMTTAVAAIPPAIVAAYRDPVRILRVP